MQVFAGFRFKTVSRSIALKTVWVSFYIFIRQICYHKYWLTETVKTVPFDGDMFMTSRGASMNILTLSPPISLS